MSEVLLRKRIRTLISEMPSSPRDVIRRVTSRFPEYKRRSVESILRIAEEECSTGGVRGRLLISKPTLAGDITEQFPYICASNQGTHSTPLGVFDATSSRETNPLSSSQHNEARVTITAEQYSRTKSTYDCLGLSGDSTSNTTSLTKKDDTIDGKRRKSQRGKSEITHLPSQRLDVDRTFTMYSNTPAFTLSEYGGIERLMPRISALILDPFTHPKVYQDLGVSPATGILVCGPPGCGKTFLVEAIAGELIHKRKIPLTFVNVDANRLVSGVTGGTENNIADLFDSSFGRVPAILYIDHLEVLCPRSESGTGDMHGRMLAQLGSSLDRVYQFNNSGRGCVMVIATSSLPDGIEPTLRRSGRIDREICIGMPNEETRLSILKKIVSFPSEVGEHLSKKGNQMRNPLRISSEVDLDSVAFKTAGYVGSDLRELLNEAGMIAANRIINDFTPSVDQERISSNEMVTHRDDNPFSREISAKSRFIRPFDIEQAILCVRPSSRTEGFTTAPNVDWSDVGALGALRKDLEKVICRPITHSGLHQKFGITTPAGILLFGPPGCGKTLLAKAVARASGAGLIAIKGPEVLNKYVGESERAIRVVFERARMSTPCVIFFDEIDAVVPRRGNPGEVGERVVNQLLTELDGIHERNGVFIVAATNRPDMIDPAVLRPGRIGRLHYVPLPDMEGRIEIIASHLRNVPLADDVCIKRIAEKTVRFSGADLSNVVKEASMLAIDRIISLRTEGSAEENKYEIVSMSDFDGALTKLQPSVSIEEEERYLLLCRKLHVTMG